MEDYKVDFTLLDKERPIGVSGLMRVKNDGDFVSLSIDSCITALDELVIVYDDSEDNTEEIILKKQAEYPSKIKVYHYEPQICSHNLSDSEIDYLASIPEDSPQLLSSYYNWTMSKVTYRYAIKIDADQFYFTEKLKAVCNLYKSNESKVLLISERLSYLYYDQFVNRLFFHMPSCLFPLMSRILVRRWIAEKVQSYIYKKICNDKIISSFSGLNILCDKDIYIPLGKFCDGIQPPTNGSGDHIFFKPNSHDIYKPWPQKKHHRMIEVYKPKDKMYFGGGFLWLHLNPMRKDIFKRNLFLYKGHMVKFEDFLNKNFFDIYCKHNLDFSLSSKSMKCWIYQSLIVDKQIIIENIENYSSFFQKWSCENH